MMKHLPFWYTACSFLTPLSEGSTYWAAPAAVHFAPRFYLKLSVSLWVAKTFSVYGARKGKSHPPSWKANVIWCYVLTAQNKTESWCLASPSETNVSFFSSLLKFKEDVWFALCLCIERDSRRKRALISVLGHAWARFSFFLWTGEQKNRATWQSFIYSCPPAPPFMFGGPNLSLLAPVSPLLMSISASMGREG